MRLMLVSSLVKNAFCPLTYVPAVETKPSFDSDNGVVLFGLLNILAVRLRHKKVSFARTLILQ